MLLAAITILSLAGVHAAPRLIGGGDAHKGDWPFVAAIDEYSSSTWNHLCGGAIISTRYLVTAAYCVSGRDSATLRVMVGGVNRGTGDEEQLVTVQSFLAHESYNAANVPPRNDIAIIRTSTGLVASSFVGSISLPPVNENHEGQICWTAGWGYRTYGATAFNNILRETQVTVITNAACLNSTQPGGAAIRATNICTENANKVICRGDEGAPLACLDATSNWRLGGVASWYYWDGVGCNSTVAGASVYTRVERYLDWIIVNTP